MDTRPDTARPSLRDLAYRSIRDLIVTVQLEPGTIVREDDLQQRLGIGRTPVREALQRLEAEQFVAVIPRRGVLVSGVDVSELSMLLETRMVLEPYAARLAAVRGSRTHWAAMEDALGHEPDDPQGQLATDRRCHEVMWAAAGNRFLVNTLDTLYAQSDRLWHMYLSDVEAMADAVDDHRAVLAALRHGDPEEAARLMVAHIQSFDAQIRAAVARRLEHPLALTVGDS